MNWRSHLLAGHAIFTLTNTQTGKSFTYRITTDLNKPHFVAVLTGPDNQSDYTFIGTIFDGKVFRHSLKGGVGKEALSVKGFEWLWRNLDRLPAYIRLNSCGYCLRCGKMLTDRISLETGYGPFCRTQIERVAA